MRDACELHFILLIFFKNFTDAMKKLIDHANFFSDFQGNMTPQLWGTKRRRNRLLLPAILDAPLR